MIVVAEKLTFRRIARKLFLPDVPPDTPVNSVKDVTIRVSIITEVVYQYTRF